MADSDLSYARVSLEITARTASDSLQLLAGRVRACQQCNNEAN